MIKKMKKKVLKKGAQSTLEKIVGCYLAWVVLTIGTLEKSFKEIKPYIIITLIFTLISLVSMYLLKKYGKESD